jgi:hypothetical protein
MLDGLGAIGGLQDFVALEAADLSDEGSDVRIVLNDQNAVLAAAGE